MRGGAPGEIRTPGLLVSASGGLYPSDLAADKSFLISSLPCPHFKNRSRRMASALVAKISWWITLHGPRFLVDLVSPQLCCPKR